MEHGVEDVMYERWEGSEGEEGRVVEWVD
jgi:hypothetical protein